MPLFGVCEEKQKIKGRRGEEGNPSICLSVVGGGGGRLRRVYSRVSSKLGMPEPSQLAIFDGKEQQL